MSTEIGTNRTGMDMSPMDAEDILDAAQTTPPTSPGDERDAARLRADYAADAPPIGSVPPPTTVKGALKAAVQAIQGKTPAALIDKLGERLAFERSGSRLYEALIAKLDGKGSFPGGPSREDLLVFRDEEVRHFALVRDAMDRLGGDPTAMTPSGNLVGVASVGLLQVIADPRTTLAQGLEALLVAELTDNDGWQVLIEMARAFGQDDMVSAFQVARSAEERHLEVCRRWVSDHALLTARGEAEEEQKAA